MSGNDERMNVDQEPRATRGSGSRRRPPAARAATPSDEMLTEDEHLDDGNEPLSELDLTDDEMWAAFEDSLNQSVLPPLPEMTGYHVCWLSTTNARDTIPNRMRMGYELIRAEQLPGFVCDVSPETAHFPGVISVNEMVAARIPMARYQKMMQFVHHRLPMQEEAKMRASLDQKKAEAEEVGGRIIEGDGMKDLAQRVPMPRFA